MRPSHVYVGVTSTRDATLQYKVPPPQAESGFVIPMTLNFEFSSSRALTSCPSALKVGVSIAVCFRKSLSSNCFQDNIDSSSVYARLCGP